MTHRGFKDTINRLEALAASRESACRAALAAWWQKSADTFDGLADGRTMAGHVGVVREETRASLLERLVPVGPLDHDAVAGAFAAWWDASRPDISALAHHGYAEVVDGWLQDVRSRLEPVLDPRTSASRRPSAAERRAVYEHPLVRHLLPGFAAELRAADDAVAAVSGRKAGKTELRAARLRVEQMEALVCPSADALPGGTRLDRERSALGARHGEGHLVREILYDRLQAEVEQRLRTRREQLHDRYRTWEEKYAESLADLRAASDTAGATLWKHLREMGYAN